jgi:hypothetical protein
MDPDNVITDAKLPVDDLTRRVAEFLFAFRDLPHIEIECRVGLCKWRRNALIDPSFPLAGEYLARAALDPDTPTPRFTGPHATEAINTEPHLSEFVPGLSRQGMQNLLTAFSRATGHHRSATERRVAPAHPDELRAGAAGKMTFHKTETIDHYVYLAKGSPTARAVVDAIRKQFDPPPHSPAVSALPRPNQDIRVRRVTVAGSQRSRYIYKGRCSHIDLICPLSQQDLRLSVSVEIDVTQALVAAAAAEHIQLGSLRPALTRHKLRRSFRLGPLQADITKVTTPAADGVPESETFEAEYEFVDMPLFNEACQLADEGNLAPFCQLVEGLLSNSRSMALAAHREVNIFHKDG